MRGPPETETPEETEGGESEPLHGGRSPAPGAAYRCCSGAKGEHRKSTRAAMLKWGSLAMLVLQNSSLFVVTRYTRSPDRRGRMYLSSVAVLVVEICKLLICLILLAAQSRGSLFDLGTLLHQQIWVERTQTLRLAIPATCYAVQNNLVFVALSHLSAAATQVLYQMKTLSTAVCTVLLLSKSFKPAQWASFVVLTVGVVLVQGEDGKSSSTPTGAQPALGVVAALTAAALSGFAGVYLEKVFTSGNASLWMRNVQLCLFTIPWQLLAIAQSDAQAIRRHGWFQGFHASTWLVVAIQVGGALLTAVVIKHAGNVLKTFATVLAILLTIIWSMVLFDFHPTALFGIGALLVAASVFLYARPDDVSSRLKWCQGLAMGGAKSSPPAPAGVVRELTRGATI